MWTGKRIFLCFLVLHVFLYSACRPKNESQVEQDSPIPAWWYGIEFSPTSTTVRGIDVRAIAPTWRRATALTPVLLEGRITPDELRQFETSNLKFWLQSDPDGDGTFDDLFVGVFETVEGTKGRFVAIIRNGRPVQHFEENGAAGFSALLQNQHEVRWYKCAECDDFESLKWSGGSYVLE